MTVCYSPVAIDKVHLSSPGLGMDGVFRLVLRAPVGRSFLIQTSDNLTDWKDWFAGRTVDPDTYITTRLLFDESSPHFFRAAIEP